MTAEELKAVSDSHQQEVRQADFDKVMNLMIAEANKGNYKLEYKEEPLKSTIKKLEDPPNLFFVKDLWANEGMYVIKWN